jgi:hypothetical protein
MGSEKETIAGVRHNGRDAPRAGIHWACPKPLQSTKQTFAPTVLRERSSMMRCSKHAKTYGRMASEHRLPPNCLPFVDYLAL